MSTIVIHHSADFDGQFCREIARKFLPGAELVGWNFGDPPITIERVANKTIYVMDLPIDRVFGMDFVKNPESKEGSDWSGIIWIDHHKTSIASHPTNIPGYRIDGVAACRLAWQWFTIVDGNTPPVGAEIGIPIRPAGVLPMIQDFKNREVNEPLAVRLAGEYDIWDKRDPNAELFQFGLRSRELVPEYWEGLLGERGEGYTDTLLLAGVPLQYAREVEYRDVIQQQGFDIYFEGLAFLACNSHELDIRSQLFEAGIKPHHDALMGFTFTGKDWRISLYGVPHKPDIDLSVIAAQFGGGGHKQACGFQALRPPTEWYPFVEIS